MILINNWDQESWSMIHDPNNSSSRRLIQAYANWSSGLRRTTLSAKRAKSGTLNSKLNLYHAMSCSRLWMHNSVALNPDQKMQVGMGVAARQTLRSPLCPSIQFSPPGSPVSLSLTCCIPHDYGSNDLDNFTFSEPIPLSFFRFWRNFVRQHFLCVHILQNYLR